MELQTSQLDFFWVELTVCQTEGVNTNGWNVNKMTAHFNQSVLDAAKSTIPRGARNNYKPYWSEELQDLEDDVSRTREEVENNPTVENNISHKASCAKYKKTYIQAARKSWREKTESLNLDKDGNKLWKLAKAMNNEGTRSAPICIQQGEKKDDRKESCKLPCRSLWTSW